MDPIGEVVDHWQGWLRDQVRIRQGCKGKGDGRASTLVPGCLPSCAPSCARHEELKGCHLPDSEMLGGEAEVALD
eukprot:scaffold135125_cov15-Tisochrysis_lutea.AAC.1